ncbi:MAG TPA: Flp family type IVb pilin [Candidatus Saccharimonadales bacterium]|nr:Flp family type IVb pilin [Candidatus Saccharimonadales bacterium]
MVDSLMARIAMATTGIASDEEGQGLVEYALILVLVSVVCIGLLAALGLKVGDVFTSITTTL